MKDYIRQIIEKVADNNLRRCLVREYLQARMLQILQDGGFFSTWAFVGGTALRFLYSMPRFSEDLDFSLVKSGIEDNFADVLKKTKTAFEAEGYTINIKAKTQQNVRNAFLKFEHLLYELGCSPHKSEVISVKLEIDTNPPAGANLTSTIVRKHIVLNLQHYDNASLFAGKLHAVLARDYVKGRDLYDLLWYLSDRTWPEPNITLLNNALKQTGWQGKPITKNNWRKQTAQRVESLNWTRVIDDVRPFIEHQKDLSLLTKDSILKLLQQR
jgi:predicted nucleotidyltransferase component of viral defense system